MDQISSADIQRKGSLQHPGSSGKAGGCDSPILKMKIACSGVGRHKEVRSTEGAADCLEEEGCEKETAIGDVSAGL